MSDEALHIEDEWFWRAMHSVYLDGLENQGGEMREFLTQTPDSLSFDFFIRALVKEFIRVVPLPGPDDQPCLGLELRGEDGDYLLLCGIEAERVGVDPEMVNESLTAIWAETFDALAQGVQP